MHLLESAWTRMYVCKRGESQGGYQTDIFFSILCMVAGAARLGSRGEWRGTEAGGEFLLLLSLGREMSMYMRNFG